MNSKNKIQREWQAVFSTEGEFEIKDLRSILENTGTKKCIFDKSISKSIKNIVKRWGYEVLEVANKKLKQSNNLYESICDGEDFAYIESAKLNNATLITHDYGQFTAAHLERVNVIYLPNKEELQKGSKYFLKKRFKKRVGNFIWRCKKT